MCFQLELPLQAGGFIVTPSQRVFHPQHWTQEVSQDHCLWSPGPVPSGSFLWEVAVWPLSTYQ